ncbi:Uncharacterized protein APZ42_022895 [Daphnia magna]|uniref:Uncharacterized protein n=1 Tax=Daphnia magna TaxID=35525 RepID=A0A164VWA2_9CRUS|nr:Uncharacterized protein APZ42_022895 [Daphnia magna]
MSVKVEDQNFGVTCVTWKCEMSYKTCSFEKMNFKLNRVTISHTS